MRALCLDLGTSTGYAILDGDAIVEWGEWPMPDSSEPLGVRFMAWDNWLILRTLRDPVVQAVVYEVPFGKYVNVLKIQFGQASLIDMRAERAGIEYMGVRPQEIKSFATGKGNAGKDQMREALTERAAELGLPEPDEETTENEIDAIWVAAYTRDVLAVTDGPGS